MTTLDGLTAERDFAIEQVMDRYHHVGPNHVPEDDPIGECGECADIVGMFLVVEKCAVARHVRETGCDGLTVENERLRSALSACGDYIVGLGLPMGARPVWETEYHALIDLIDGLLGGKHYPWLAALPPTVAASEEDDQ